jgi:rubrerythrin
MNRSTLLGALEGAADQVVTRRGALLRTGRMAGALAAASMPLTLGRMSRKAFAQGGIPDEVLAVLNFALTLERLEDEFYKAGLASSLDFGETRPIFEQISKHETAHVALLTNLLGDAAEPAPTFDFTGGGAFSNVLSNLDTFVALAQGFEDTGVRAYKGQAGALLGQSALLTTALRIHSVEARHAAMIRRLPNSPAQKAWVTGNSTSVAALQPIYEGEEVTTQLEVDLLPFGSAEAVSEAFDEPLTQEQVVAIITPFLGPPEEPPPEEPPA